MIILLRKNDVRVWCVVVLDCGARIKREIPSRTLQMYAYVEIDGNWGRGNERIRDELVVCMLYDRGQINVANPMEYWEGGGVTIIVCAIRMIRKRRMRETETTCKDIK